MTKITKISVHPPPRRREERRRLPAGREHPVTPNASGVSICTFVLVKQVLFCTSKASVPVQLPAAGISNWHLLQQRQYLYFCTSKASKLSTCEVVRTGRILLEVAPFLPEQLCQYLYFCTSKASKLSTCSRSLHVCPSTPRSLSTAAASAFVLLYQ
jgi:hypothetical protein